MILRLRKLSTWAKRSNAHVYRVYTNKILVTRDVKFFESELASVKSPGTLLVNSKQIVITFPRVCEPPLTNKKSVSWFDQVESMPYPVETELTPMDDEPEANVSKLHDKAPQPLFASNMGDANEDADSGVSVEDLSESESEQEVSLDPSVQMNIPVHVDVEN